MGTKSRADALKFRLVGTFLNAEYVKCFFPEMLHVPHKKLFTGSSFLVGIVSDTDEDISIRATQTPA